MNYYPDQVFAHPSEPSPGELEPVENSNNPFKPKGGLWTSSYQEDTSAWIEWMHREEWAPHACEEMNVWLLEPADELDIYQIDSHADLRQLADTYARENVSITAITMLDYEAIAQDYDGIWLTAQGQAETRFSQPNLYGWDTECTLHFSWEFETVESADIELAFENQFSKE